MVESSTQLLATSLPVIRPGRLKDIYYPAIRDRPAGMRHIGRDDDRLTRLANPGLLPYCHFQFPAQYIGYLFMDVLMLRQNAPCLDPKMCDRQIIRMDHSAEKAFDDLSLFNIFKTDKRT